MTYALEVLEAYPQALFALLIDTRWSNSTIGLILNESDMVRRYELIDIWRGHRLADLERVNLTVCNSQ